MSRHGQHQNAPNPYGSYAQDPYGQDAYGQDEYGRDEYVQDPRYSQHTPYGGNPYGTYTQVEPARPAYPHQAAARPPLARRRGVRAGLLTAVVAAAVVGGVAAYGVTQHTKSVADASPLPASAASAQGASTFSGLNLKVSQVPAGTVVTNDGFTVYRFEKDTAKPSVSNCNAACATAWPPVLATDTPWLKGVPSDKVGTVTRADGTKQLTLGGWPLYRYAKDAAPGDTKGQGVGGTWCAVGPDGKPAKLTGAPAAPAAGSTNATGSSGYGSGGSGAAASPAPSPAPASGGDSGYSSGGY